MPSSKSARNSAMSEPRATHVGILGFVPVFMYMPDDDDDFVFWAATWYWAVPLFFHGAVVQGRHVAGYGAESRLRTRVDFPRCP